MIQVKYIPEGKLVLIGTHDFTLQLLTRVSTNVWRIKWKRKFVLREEAITVFDTLN